MNAPQGGVCNIAPAPNILTNFRPEHFLICTTRLSTEQKTNRQALVAYISPLIIYVFMPTIFVLTHWGRDQMAVIFLTFWNAFFNENVSISI